MEMSAIAAVGQNWELGKNNDLLWKSKEDLAHFKAYTMGKALLVGPKTYLSMPPMKGRKVICVAQCFHDRPMKAKQLGDVFLSETYCGLDFEEMIEEAAGPRKIVLIGGAETYRVFAAEVTELVLTRFNQTDADADTYFPKDSYSELLERTAITHNLTDIIAVQTYTLKESDK